MSTYAVRFTVVGHNSLAFPIDMLRYDCCYPSDQESVGELTDSMIPELRAEARRDRASDVAAEKDPERAKKLHDAPLFRVRLTALVIRKDWKPTAERWSSFGWQVEPGSMRTDKL